MEELKVNKEAKIKQLTDEIEAKIRIAINYGIELGRALERQEQEESSEE